MRRSLRRKHAGLVARIWRPPWSWVVWLGLVVAASGFGAEPGQLERRPTRTPTTNTTEVGGLGRKEAIRFEGNQSFSKEQFLEGLSRHIQFHLASHPRAPVQEYPPLLEKLLLRGYQHAGFATPEIRANVDTNQLAVRIQEGTRYRCGPLLLSGISSMTNNIIRQTLTTYLAGFEPGPTPSTNEDNAVWPFGQWAPLEPATPRRLEKAIQSALVNLGYYDPEMEVRLLTDPAKKLANLSVEFKKEGVPLTLQEVEINGLRSNTRTQVLSYLQLQLGTRAAPDLISQIETQLWKSARFLHHEVTLESLPEPGKVRLHLDLEELRGPPPLTEEFSPEAKVMLKFRDWLSAWQKGTEDIRLTMSSESSAAKLPQVDAALSSTGFVMVARGPASNAPPTFALVVGAAHKGLYSLWRGEKFVTHSASGWLVQLRVEPKNINFGVGVTNTTDFPFVFELSPAAFTKLLYRPGTTAKLADGVLSLSYTDETNSLTTVRIDASSGRLLKLTTADTNHLVVVRPEKGAFAQLVSNIDSASRQHANAYEPERPFSSWLSFLMTDLAESSWIEQMLKDPPNGYEPSDDTLASLRRARSILILCRSLVGKETLAKVFEPLNRLIRTNVTDETQKEEVEFTIPPEDPLKADNQGTMAVVAAYLLSHVDSLIARDSWLATLSRESLLTLAGQGRYTEAELKRFLASDEVGPAACLATAAFLGRVNPKAARAIAQQGLSRLSPAALHQDYEVLFQESSILAEMAELALGRLRHMNETQVKQLIDFFPSASSGWAKELSRRLQDKPNLPAAQAAWPILEAHWDDLVRPALQSGLNHFLPQVQFLTEPKALYERGLVLVRTQAALQDFDEAAQCFRKAAEMGHGGAKIQLGLLLERGQGVAQDYAQAVRWYQQAAEQKTPHATCRLGACYGQGHGVDKDLVQAARWLRVEADTGCSSAQLYLGRVCEEQLNMDEALQWYRRAATGGDVAAQARLGDLLSDGFSTTPDYLEACQWLILATRKEGEDRLSEHRLRRAKAKLTSEQLFKAEDEADKVSEQLQKLAEQQKKAANH